MEGAPESELEPKTISLTEAETVLALEGRVERMFFDKNAKRFIVERYGGGVPTAHETSVFLGGGFASDVDAAAR
ncbi:MAG: hypothetical protein HUK22_07570, partial [Thermoguttaceae bacterium]|nr:hypothetical protein [Thermoguttaceae bacterium]